MVTSVATPSVCVVLPVRNGRRFLAEAVQSVLDQSMDEWELIVVDDGSTDGSGDAVREFDDERIRVIPSTGSGISAALNTGIAASRADLIARLDADDACHPDRLRRQKEEFERRPTLGILGTAYTAIDERGDVLFESRVITSPHLRRALFAQNRICHGSVMFRRPVMEQIGGYVSEYQHAEDYELWCRAVTLTSYDVDNLIVPLYRYRISDTQVSSQHLARQIASAEAVRDEMWKAHAPPRPDYRLAVRRYADFRTLETYAVSERVFAKQMRAHRGAAVALPALALAAVLDARLAVRNRSAGRLRRVRTKWISTMRSRRGR